MIEKTIQSYLKRNDFTKLTPKAVFFDMDGVLIDSMSYHSKSWVSAMNDFGLPFTPIESYLFEGQKGVDTVNYVFAKTHGRESTQEEQNAIYDLKLKYFNKLGEPKPMPYAYEILKTLKSQGYHLFVVTGSAHPMLLENIQNFFPDIFDRNDIISAFDVKNGKPHPEPYLKALEKANVEPWEAVVIENAPFGVKASSEAKIYTIGVNTGPLENQVLLDNGAEIVFGSMQELAEKWNDFGF